MACYLLLMAGVYWTSFIIKIYNYKRCGENTDRRLDKNPGINWLFIYFYAS